MRHLLALLGFACAHANYTWPQFNRKTRETWVACLDCGKQIPYDWDEMRRVA